MAGLAYRLVMHCGYPRLFRNKRSLSSTELERPCNLGGVGSYRRAEPSPPLVCVKKVTRRFGSSCHLAAELLLDLPRIINSLCGGQT